MNKLSGFKAYDIRGKVPDELNEELAYKIGYYYAKYLNAGKIIVGYDIRESSKLLSSSLADGINDFGAEVIDIGLCGTEMIYFGTSFLDTDGGIMITASHNPPEYNGMKFVKKNSVPVGYNSGLNEIEKMIVKENPIIVNDVKGKVTDIDLMNDFITNLKNFYDASKIKPLKVVVNAGNGCAGLALDELEKLLPIEMIKIFNNPDSAFPNGVPNPLLPDNRAHTIEAVKKHNADLGVAWDGDYDRCFFFDEHGNFIEGYYIVGLLAKSILKNNPGENIVHDPRLIWNTLEIVKSHGGTPVQSVSGHAFIKEKMREVDAIYGGEMSAHHYFRNNAYSDSGMIPFLLVLQLISGENKTLSELVGGMIEKYPCPGEINSSISNPKEKLEQIAQKYTGGKKDRVDGLSVEYENWRFNLRISNTEPIIRLNVETRGDVELMKQKTKELLREIRDEKVEA
ncbi:MAG TPA: phosphomannomutase [Ignavibacteria bacterium]|nr:phosphomannomutase [Ignavibacteria bacterium]